MFRKRCKINASKLGFSFCVFFCLTVSLCFTSASQPVRMYLHATWWTENIILGQHRMHSVDRCGAFLQMSWRSVVCVCMLVTTGNPAVQKWRNRSRCRLTCWLAWIGGVRTSATWRTRLNDLCSTAMRPAASITVSTCVNCRSRFELQLECCWKVCRQTWHTVNDSSSPDARSSLFH